MAQVRIEVKLSKKKNILLLLGCIAFVGTSIWLTSIPYNEGTRFGNPLITIVGWVGIVFFGVAGIYGMYKLFDGKPGLVLDERGIWDNSSAVAGHWIAWECITGVRVGKVHSTTFLLIDILDPNQFMDETKGIKKKLLQANNNLYGTPISISSSILQCSNDELLEMINRGVAAYWESHKTS